MFLMILEFNFIANTISSFRGYLYYYFMSICSMHYIIDNRQHQRDYKRTVTASNLINLLVFSCSRHTSLGRQTTRTQFIALTLPFKKKKTLLWLKTSWSNEMIRVRIKAMKLNSYIFKNTLILENRVTNFYTV